MQIICIQIIIFISSFYLSIQNPNSEIPSYLSSNIIEDIKNLLFILPEDITISFNNSLINVTLYNTSDKSFSYEKMNINFENCLTILQKVYDLDPFFDYTNSNSNEIYKGCFFIIIKIELDRKISKNNNFFITNNISMGLPMLESNSKSTMAKNNSIIKRPTNHIEYLIFNGKNGKLLNTSYCNDLKVKILHPIIKQDIIDLNSSKKFYEQYQIDVFRTNDSFFNDVCMNYTSDKNKDMTLSQRRQYFYQNVSFCDANCTYVEINYTSNTAICACEINGVMNDKFLFEENNEKEKTFTYNDIISVINYKIFKCYKQVFDPKRLLVNVGNYFSFVLIVLYTACVIHFYKNRKLNIMSYYQKIKTKINNENSNKKNTENKTQKDQKSSNSIDLNDNKSSTNKKISNQESNKDILSYNSEEDKKGESDNKTINEININDISIKDIAAHPPLKKGKLKLKINPKDNQNKISNMKKYIMNINNSATKDTYNYGEIKLDTADELIDGKNNINNNNDEENIEHNWNEIITLKKKPKKNIIISTNSMLSSTKQNSSKSNMKKSSDSSNLNKSNNSNKDDEYNNNYNIIFPSNNGVEIPISNIVPSFLKSKNNLINASNIQNIKLNSRNLRNSQRLKSLYSSKELSSSQNSQNVFIYKKNLTKSTNAMHNNFITKHDHDIISEKEDENNIWNNNTKLNKKSKNNVHNSTLRRSKEIEAFKRTKNKKKEGKNKRKRFFEDFDEMKFEIAILIDNRNFCKKFVCELKEKCIIIFLLFRKDVIFKQIELSSFLLSCTLDYFFNAFLYSDVYLEQEFEQENLIRIFIDYPKEIFSSLASQFVVKLIQLLIDEHAISLFLKRIAVDNMNYLRAINFLLKKYQKRFFIYIIINYLFLFVTWYFTSAFCTVYQNTQLNLLYDTLESLALNIFLPLPLSFFSIVFRHLAILKLNKFLFFISNIFRIFA